MAGLGLVLSIARDALAAQRYGIDVTSHNIANVNTPGYSRQSPVQVTKEPAPCGKLLLGRGVDTTQVIRACDQFVENELMQKKSGMTSYKEMENYVQILEQLFNETSETSTSSMLADFWNLWQDISNNPSGDSERIALYRKSEMLSEHFTRLSEDLTQLGNDLTSAINAGINEINQITDEIAQLNAQITATEASSTANDFRDKRNVLLSKLSQDLNIKAFEQSNGSLTIVTARGCVLVNQNSSYHLEVSGDNGDRVVWHSSGDTTVDITNYITTGKLGGWLDMRDKILAKYSLDLDALVKEFIWAVNQQHAQGVGLEGFSTLEGTYAVSSTQEELGTLDSGLPYYNKIKDGTFKIWVYDSSGNVVGEGPTTISIDANPGGTTLEDLRDTINDKTTNPNLQNLTATIAQGKLEINADTGFTFAFSDDTSNVLPALGINTFFQGSSAGSIAVNPMMDNKDFIAAAQIDTDGSFTSGDNTNAIAIAGLQHISTDIPEWTCNRVNGNTEGSITATIEGYYRSMVGSIGIVSQNISRAKDFNEAMVNRLSEIRDSVSGVSLDEEIANLMKYQHAYSAAAKLISISDEMLNTLLNVK